MAKKPSYVYGHSPSPKDWHQAAITLRDIKGNKPKRSSGLMDRLDAIEQALKVKK